MNVEYVEQILNVEILRVNTQEVNLLGERQLPVNEIEEVIDICGTIEGEVGTLVEVPICTEPLEIEIIDEPLTMEQRMLNAVSTLEEVLDGRVLTEEEMDMSPLSEVSNDTEPDEIEILMEDLSSVEPEPFEEDNTCNNHDEIEIIEAMEGNKLDNFGAEDITEEPLILQILEQVHPEVNTEVSVKYVDNVDPERLTEKDIQVSHHVDGEDREYQTNSDLKGDKRWGDRLARPWDLALHDLLENVEFWSNQNIAFFIEMRLEKLGLEKRPRGVNCLQDQVIEKLKKKGRKEKKDFKTESATQMNFILRSFYRYADKEKNGDKITVILCEHLELAKLVCGDTDIIGGRLKVRILAGLRNRNDEWQTELERTNRRNRNRVRNEKRKRKFYL